MDRPFGVVTTSDGRWSFVSIAGVTQLMSDRSFVPTFVRSILLPNGLFGAGETLSADGRYLLVAAGSGAVVIDVGAAVRGESNAVLGVLSSGIQQSGAIEVTLSRDDRYVFVSLENAQRIAVFDLADALDTHFRKAPLVGLIPLHGGVVGMALSPDGRWLYATAGGTATTSTASSGPVHSGTLSVIDVRRAADHPAVAVIASSPAGCDPVRVVVSPDGSTVWVTARESDALLAFSASALRSDPKHALVTHLRVGEAPVALLMLTGSRTLVVADSNRFSAPGMHANLIVVNTVAALKNRSAIVGTVATGNSPRELALEPDAPTLLVTNYESMELQAVDVASLSEP